MLLEWQSVNPPPASMMLISDDMDGLSYGLIRRQQRKRTHYNILRGYTRIPKYVSLLYTTAEFLWESLLATPTEEETRIQSRECSSLDHPFCCTTCRVTTGSAETFTTHLSGEDHKEREVYLARSKLPDPGGYHYEPPQVEEDAPKSKKRKSKRSRNRTLRSG